MTRRSVSRRRWALGAAAVCIFICVASRRPPAPPPPQAARNVAITLLATTDIHGHIFPVEEETGRPAELGLAKIATLIAQERASHPNTLLLDCGDTTQGTALAWYAARRRSGDPNPIIAAMNALGYDAMAIGNHDFNFGMDHLRKIRREAQFRILAANVTGGNPNTDEPFSAHVVREVAGVRVAVVGFVTPGVLHWEMPENYRGFRFHSIVETAAMVIPKVRAKADLVVVISHSGLGRDPADAPDENSMAQVAEQVPGIDVILFGHTHREVPEKILNGVLLSQPKFWGQSLSEVEIALERQAGGWRVTSKKSRIIPVTDAVPPAPDVLKLAEVAWRGTEAFLDQPVAGLSRPLDGATARLEDHPLLDLIHAAQLDAGHADVSLATLFQTGVRFPAGTPTARQFYALYPYENTLFTVEMTGAQLKEILERAASFYPAWPLASAGRSAVPGAPGETAHPSLPGYQADTAAGVSYTLDLSQPVGSRIRDLAFRGRPLEPARGLRVAVNHYRYYGGGGYGMYQGLRIVQRSRDSVRDLVIAYARRVGSIPATAAGTWRIEPAEAREALLREARGRAQTSAGAQPPLPAGFPERVHVLPAAGRGPLHALALPATSR
jgi:2',3'-cyclic-nucleotide 2'-phosphodiesterase/3'-nucleotidase